MFLREFIPWRVLWTAMAIAPVVLLSAAPAAVAQDGGASPHGDLDQACSDCHTEEAWTPLREPLLFDHSDMGFTLEMSHADAECIACHRDLEFRLVPSSCADCHADPHRGAQGFDCESCHRPETWDLVSVPFDVHDATLFPLVGAHVSVDCDACHTEGPPFEFSSAPLDCFSCHVEDYLATDEPDHQRASFPTSCESCHVPTVWEEARFGAGFDHSVFFPLEGSHLNLDCSACHAEGFAGTPTDCFSCHRADYDATTDPDHRDAGFPTDCELCHVPTSWEDADFDHDFTAFALTGAHRPLDCDACHAQGFSGTPTDCVACHRADYNQTSDPDHRAAGFPTDCEVCHTTQTWEGAEFNHDNTSFPLTGAHRPLDCDSCHADGFSGTPDDCVACHRADYNQTTDPNHRASGFPTDCEDCHDTRSWEGATFNHGAFFPINSGSHRGVWDDCSDCHTNPNNFSVFSCTVCHERDEMDDEHDDVSGYVYQSPACLDCHPNGEKD